MSTYGYFKHDEMSDYAISHHGIKGQKWGIRRYQNEDGSLTAEGMRRYGVYSNNKQIANKFDSMTSQLSKNKKLLKDKSFMDEYKKVGNDWENELKKYKDKDYRKSMKAGKKMEKAGIKPQANTAVKEKNNEISKDNFKKVTDNVTNAVISNINYMTKTYGTLDNNSNDPDNKTVFWEDIDNTFYDLDTKYYNNLSNDSKRKVIESVMKELVKNGYKIGD